MNIYILNEDFNKKERDIKKFTAKESLSSILIPPVSSLSSRKKERLIKLLKSKNAVYFSKKSVEESLPSLFNEDADEFFYDCLPKALFPLSQKEGVKNSRFNIVLFNPPLNYALIFLPFFPNLYLFGDESEKTGSEILRKTGAAIPFFKPSYKKEPSPKTLIIFFSSPHAKDNDPKDFLSEVFMNKNSFENKIYDSAYFYVHPSFETKEGFLGKDGLLFYPEGKYKAIVSLIKEPLSIKAAYRLLSLDKSATFNILTNLT